MYIFSPCNFTYRPIWRISLRMNYMVKFFLPRNKTTRFILYSYCYHGSSEFHVVQVRADNFSKLRNNHLLYSCLPICGTKPIRYFFVLYLPFGGCPHKYLSKVGEVWIITKNLHFSPKRWPTPGHTEPFPAGGDEGLKRWQYDPEISFQHRHFKYGNLAGSHMSQFSSPF